MGRSVESDFETPTLDRPCSEVVYRLKALTRWCCPELRSVCSRARARTSLSLPRRDGIRQQPGSGVTPRAAETGRDRPIAMSVARAKDAA